MDKQPDTEMATKIILALGGVCAVARLLDIKQPSVSEWKKTGIPKARQPYFRLLRPDLFKTQNKH